MLLTSFVPNANRREDLARLNTCNPLIINSNSILSRSFFTLVHTWRLQSTQSRKPPYCTLSILDWWYWSCFGSLRVIKTGSYTCSFVNITTAYNTEWIWTAIRRSGASLAVNWNTTDHTFSILNPGLLPQSGLETWFVSIVGAPSTARPTLTL